MIDNSNSNSSTQSLRQDFGFVVGNQRFDNLHALPRADLIEMWQKLFGTSPYKGIRNGTLIRGIAYQLQARTLGGLKSATSRMLLKLAKGEFGSAVGLPQRPKVQTGSRMVREWNGRTYEVLKTDDGFLMSGSIFGSLSACAREITGAHWSGPRFFGVQT